VPYTLLSLLFQHQHLHSDINVCFTVLIIFIFKCRQESLLPHNKMMVALMHHLLGNLGVTLVENVFFSLQYIMAAGAVTSSLILFRLTVRTFLFLFLCTIVLLSCCLPFLIRWWSSRPSYLPSLSSVVVRRCRHCRGRYLRRCCRCSRRHPPPPLPVICLIVVCITKEL